MTEGKYPEKVPAKQT